jgi:FkbM family methyltransferase
VFLPHYPLDLPCKLLEQSVRVRAGFQLWADEASRTEYAAQIAFRLLLDFDGMASPAQEHYFPRDLFHLHDHETLIDCGAFDGDTVASFIERQGARFERILAYEPDPLNWEKLLRSLTRLPANVRSRIGVFPQAIGATSGIIHFNSTGTDLSTAGNGTTAVECVELDRSLQEVTPTLIKFDIEGFELEALAGARQVLSRSRPILAVSAYHLQDHLWKVPLTLASMCSDYCYFLRPHGTEGWDLVCYAVPRERVKADGEADG